MTVENRPDEIERRPVPILQRVWSPVLFVRAELAMRSLLSALHSFDEVLNPNRGYVTLLNNMRIIVSSMRGPVLQIPP